MRFGDSMPFHGWVEWLTKAEGGRDSGPPPTPAEHDYAATAFVPPERIDTGLASFVLRVSDRSAWRSTADAAWLIVDNEPPHFVEPGVVVHVTEGSRIVAYFHVESVGW